MDGATRQQMGQGEDFCITFTRGGDLSTPQPESAKNCSPFMKGRVMVVGGEQGDMCLD